jgi:hypothetical protein
VARYEVTTAISSEVSRSVARCGRNKAKREKSVDKTRQEEGREGGRGTRTSRLRLARAGNRSLTDIARALSFGDVVLDVELLVVVLVFNIHSENLFDDVLESHETHHLIERISLP